MAFVQDFTLSNTTPTLIASGVGEIYIRPGEGLTLFLGDSGVSVSTGFRVDLVTNYGPGTEFRMHLGSTDEIWAVSSINSRVIRVLHTR